MPNPVAIFVFLISVAYAQKNPTPSDKAYLVITSGLPPLHTSVPNSLAAHPYVLLRDSYADILKRAGVTAPSGVSPSKYIGLACAGKTPDCTRIKTAIKTSVVATVRSDAEGTGILRGVPPGKYYLMISGSFNRQQLVWEQSVELKPGENSIRLDQTNATQIQ